MVFVCSTSFLSDASLMPARNEKTLLLMQLLLIHTVSDKRRVNLTVNIPVLVSVLNTSSEKGFYVFGSITNMAKIIP